jgi:hypothetical protein
MIILKFAPHAILDLLEMPMEIVFVLKIYLSKILKLMLALLAQMINQSGTEELVLLAQHLLIMILAQRLAQFAHKD